MDLEDLRFECSVLRDLIGGPYDGSQRFCMTYALEIASITFMGHQSHRYELKEDGKMHFVKSGKWYQ